MENRTPSVDDFHQRRRRRKRRTLLSRIFSRRNSVALAIVALIVLALLFTRGSDLWEKSNVPPTFSPTQIVGRATVIDGDTIEIHGQRIRLNGIDAPKSLQPCNNSKGDAYRCGPVAAKVLAELLAASSPTRCEFVERDQYGRFVGNCFLADGTNVAGALVLKGFAMDWPRYAEQQEVAKAERNGLWAGTFQPPWDWRAEYKEAEPGTSSPPLTGPDWLKSCNIKGYINDKGEQTYRVPGQPNYAQTVVDESRGGWWFCSEAEARAEGWRRALP